MSFPQHYSGSYGGYGENVTNGGGERLDLGPRLDQSAPNQEARQASPPVLDDIVKSYSCIPPNNVIGQIRAVHLQRFETKDTFICSLKDDIELQKMLEELQQDCIEREGQAYAGKLKCGEICCAKSSRDNKWHRVRVEKVEHGEYYIFDLDFGYAAKIECDKVRGIKRKFCQLPVQAFHCALEGTKPDWTVEANEWLYNFINDDLYCWFKGPPKDSTYPVSLLIEKDLRNAADKATDVEYLKENMQQLEALKSKREDIGDITAVNDEGETNIAVESDKEMENVRSADTYPEGLIDAGSPFSECRITGVTDISVEILDASSIEPLVIDLCSSSSSIDETVNEPSISERSAQSDLNVEEASPESPSPKSVAANTSFSPNVY